MPATVQIGRWPRLAACVAAAASAIGGAALAGETRGFVVTSFRAALQEGAANCPEGMAPDAQQGFLASLSPGERQRLQRPESTLERKRLLAALMQPNRLCYEPGWFASLARYPTVQDNTAQGLDLDGGDTGGKPAPGTCNHRNFTGPDGQVGIDNQFYRAVGCTAVYGAQKMGQFLDGAMRAGSATHLIQISGIDDATNDDRVEVGIFGGADAMEVDAGGRPLPDASLEISADPRFQARTTGRIRDGVLTTEPVDVMLKHPLPVYDIAYRFKSARLRLELLADGRASGMLAGYYDLDSIFSQWFVRGGMGGLVDCPGLHATLRRLADGYPDPETGQCTALSAAFTLEGLPAFVVPPTRPPDADGLPDSPEALRERGFKAYAKLSGAQKAAAVLAAHAELESFVARELQRRTKGQ